MSTLSEIKLKYPTFNNIILYYIITTTCYFIYRIISKLYENNCIKLHTNVSIKRKVCFICCTMNIK